MFRGKPNFLIQGSSGNRTLPSDTFELLLSGAVCARALLVALYIGRQGLQSYRILLQLRIRRPALVDGIAKADRVGGEADDLEDIRDQAEGLDAGHLWRRIGPQDPRSPHGASEGVVGIPKLLVGWSKLLQSDDANQNRLGVDKAYAPAS